VPYQAGIIALVAGLAIVFGTFAWLLVHARAMMLLFRGGDSEIVAGPGNPRKTPSRSRTATMLVLHFVGWGIAALAYFWMLADVAA
jgi:hypothetical protein